MKTYEDGVKDERARIIAYLKEKGVVRDAMFYPGLVAKSEYLNNNNTYEWESIDLPLTLGGEE
jgi:hypothetical protein